MTATAGIPAAERERRHARLRAAMEERRFDALLAYAPA
jgi:hypothetical protein